MATPTCLCPDSAAGARLIWSYLLGQFAECDQDLFAYLFGISGVRLACGPWMLGRRWRPHRVACLCGRRGTRVALLLCFIHFLYILLYLSRRFYMETIFLLIVAFEEILNWGFTCTPQTSSQGIWNLLIARKLFRCFFFFLWNKSPSRGWLQIYVSHSRVLTCKYHFYSWFWNISIRFPFAIPSQAIRKNRSGIHGPYQSRWANTCMVFCISSVFPSLASTARE